MPIWDFTCDVCHTETPDRLVLGREMPTCCGVEMRKLPAASAFVIHGYSAANGYTGKTRDLPSKVHGQKDMKVSVRET